LESELLRLRPLTNEDFEALYAIASDPPIWEQHPSKDRTQKPVFQQWFADAIDSGGALVAVDGRDERVIGSSRYALQTRCEEVEIGWTFLDRSHWGGTYNREMKRLMLDHAFRAVSKVVFTVHSDNVRSQKAVEKLGATRVGVAPDAQGRGENVIFHLDKDRWINRS
jgi:RimJ/RimL family protein N-acetyltransferase